VTVVPAALRSLSLDEAYPECVVAPNCFPRRTPEYRSLDHLVSEYRNARHAGPVSMRHKPVHIAPASLVKAGIHRAKIALFLLPEFISNRLERSQVRVPWSRPGKHLSRR
jgi:hypothetical protein